MERHEVEHLLVELNKKADIIMSVQDDINAATQAILNTQQVQATAESTLASDVTAIAAALAAGGGTAADTTALKAAVAAQPASDAALTQSVNDVTALVPPTGV
jgi:hypothetical protein